jgi:hypothetical protein
MAERRKGGDKISLNPAWEERGVRSRSCLSLILKRRFTFFRAFMVVRGCGRRCPARRVTLCAGWYDIQYLEPVSWRGRAGYESELYTTKTALNAARAFEIGTGLLAWGISNCILEFSPRFLAFGGRFVTWTVWQMRSSWSISLYGFCNGTNV